MKVITSLFIFLCLFTILIIPASALTYTVCASGCDFSSIQLAVSAANADDTIYIYNGTYNENIDITTTGLNIIGEGKDVVTINALNSADHVFSVSLVHSVTISGVTVKGANQNSQAGIFITGASYTNISYNNLYDNWHGIYLYNNCQESIIRNNNASNNIQIGILLHWVCSHNNIYDNIANTNGFHGYRIKEFGEYNILQNNTAINNIDNGFYMFDTCNHNHLIDNLISYNADGIRVSKNCEGNLIHGNHITNNNKGVHIIASHDNDFLCNWIHDNTDHGFFVTNKSPAVVGGADSINNNISNNNIISNVWQVNISQASNIITINNYWGTTVSSEILSCIGQNTGTITYTPFLSNPSTCGAHPTLLPPTPSTYNYFWWDNSIDYIMTGVYDQNFWINLTYGFDPDDSIPQPLTHVLSLYNGNDAFIATINDSLEGCAVDTDIFFNISDYKTFGGTYYFLLLSTDNEGTSTISTSPVFSIQGMRISKFAGTKTLLEGIPSAFQDTIDNFIRMLPFMLALSFVTFIGFILIVVTSYLKKW